MFIGYYSPLFYSAISPWTTLGPLAFVVSVSLAQEAYTDTRRHRSDKATNNHPCVVLKRADVLDHQPKHGKKIKRKRDKVLNEGKDINVRVSGKDVPIAFESLARMNIRAGDLVFVRNRDMVPADLILLASSNEGGNAYIETSSIDGETNLKLRNSPSLPVPVQRPGTPDISNRSLCNGGSKDEGDASSSSETESFSAAIQRVVSMSLLGHPDGVCALANPKNSADRRGSLTPTHKRSPKSTYENIKRLFCGDKTKGENDRRRAVPKDGEKVTYIATLTSEPPNTHVNNYSGKLTLPPDIEGERCDHAPLNAENILLRGAVLRNTEWVIGLACFTGADTKLVMNSVATPSKFSQLDMLINRTVFLILFIMIVCVCTMAGIAVHVNGKAFDQLWYSGYNTDVSEPWPYFNLEGSENIGIPEWQTETQNFFQNLFMFITLLSNFVPLSLYVSVEIITVMMMLYVGWDLHMYHDETDTPAAARSTIVTDLGLVEYIFSDKTGTLTCNIMEFKRCSVDGHVFGMPIAKAAPSGGEADDLFSDTVHPLPTLLAGSDPVSGLSQVNESNGSIDISAGMDKLTFDAEMFLRVMSICHTVVVEKDHVPTFAKAAAASPKKKKRTLSKAASTVSVVEDPKLSTAPKAPTTKKKKVQDGAPDGFAYQAESPDEGALVSAASNEYGFQLIGRNSAGVKISCPCPSIFEDDDVVKGLKDGSITSKMLAAKSSPSKYSAPQVSKSVNDGVTPRVETWPILAVNKFDSNRKRMSVLVRSPPELGSVPMLLCKGADSSMLVEGVAEGARMLDSIVDKTDDGEPAEPESEVENSELDSLLGLQAHLGGKFAFADKCL